MKVRKGKESGYYGNPESREENFKKVFIQLTQSAEMRKKITAK